MLVKIECQRFREQAVHFHPGLNVILGDNAASNSIGKSTLLMLVDFAHGGADLLLKSPEVALQLGDHNYIITFRFMDEEYTFQRRTSEREQVAVVSLAGEASNQIWSTKEYTDWLKLQYRLSSEFLSFRETVSPFTRVWKRDTLESERPLQAYGGESPKLAVDRVLKLFEAFGPLHELELKLKDLAEVKTNLTKAQKSKLIPKITKTEYKQNEVAIKDIENELQRLREEIAQSALNVRALANDAVLEAKTEKDRLLAVRLVFATRRNRIAQNLAGVGAPRRAAFESLLEFFPELNVDRLQEVETFHTSVSNSLRKELQQERKELEAELSVIDQQIASLDERIAEAVGSVDAPGYIVDRVVDVAADSQKRRQANDFYIRQTELASRVKEVREVLNERRSTALSTISERINTAMRELADRVFEPGRRSPILRIEPSGYTFNVDHDSGTGTSYVAVALLDLAILQLTSMPYVVHDSVMLKNIEIPVMERLVTEYQSQASGKQIFIAIDEIRKYSQSTQDILNSNRAIQLSHDHLLYDLDWRQNAQDSTEP